jgi:Holliday junction resolvase
MSESKIQSRIIQNLERNGWFVVKIIQTTKNGWPDLQAVKKGKTIYIEVKDVGEEPDPLQLVRHQQLRINGATVFVTDDKNFTVL